MTSSRPPADARRAAAALRQADPRLAAGRGLPQWRDPAAAARAQATQSRAARATRPGIDNGAQDDEITAEAQAAAADLLATMRARARRHADDDNAGTGQHVLALRLLATAQVYASRRARDRESRPGDPAAP